MADNKTLTQVQLVDRLADGFVALLKQVEELKRHNEEVAKLLGHEHKSPRAPISARSRDQELFIAKGAEALKTLRINRWKTPSDEGTNQVTDDAACSSMPEGHPAIDCSGLQNMKCPFASMAKEQSIERQPFTVTSPITQRPDLLPTPPETREQYIDDADAGLVQEGNKLPESSEAGSVSKCPIRMLDERPPEEIAEYFETHKHEIPRSHEICIKRYQRNEQSIRELDARYGSLVNMIQGLGMKHQPLLHNKDGADAHAKPSDAVEKWANGHVHSPGAAGIASDEGADPEEREGYFDRPLKEVRVGESPSRPWGISVPAGPPKSEDDLPGERTPGPMSASKVTVPSKMGPGASNKQALDVVEDKPHVIFNGPVFIGYPPEEAAAFLKQSGMSK